MAEVEASNDKKVLTAMAVVAVAIALVWGGVSIFNSDRTAKAGCALGASAVGALAVAMSKGRAADDVLKMAGPTLAGAGCVAAVDDLMKNNRTVLKIQTANGTFSRTVTRSELTGSLRKPTTSRMLACRGWTTPVLFEMCADGHLAPK